MIIVEHLSPNDQFVLAISVARTS